MMKKVKVKRGQGQVGEETETTSTAGFSRLDSKGLGNERSEKNNMISFISFSWGIGVDTAALPPVSFDHVAFDPKDNDNICC